MLHNSAIKFSQPQKTNKIIKLHLNMSFILNAQIMTNESLALQHKTTRMEELFMNPNFFILGIIYWYYISWPVNVIRLLAKNWNYKCCYNTATSETNKLGPGLYYGKIESILRTLTSCKHYTISSAACYKVYYYEVNIFVAAGAQIQSQPPSDYDGIKLIHFVTKSVTILGKWH